MLAILQILLLSSLTTAYLSTSRYRRISQYSTALQPSFLVSTSASTTCTLVRHLHTLQDADYIESVVGGERYEMVPLPDSMMETTLFIGNLNEFAQDGDLSALFQDASTLHSLPACVARKANYYSLEYGFVAFPNAEQTENAIMRFHNTEFMGRKIKVEAIRDHPKRGRVKVPERLVEFVSGAIKKTRSGQVNTMRRIARLEEHKKRKPYDGNSHKRKRKREKKQMGRSVPQPRLQAEDQPLKRTIRKISSRWMEDPDMQRAIRKGFVSLEAGNSDLREQLQPWQWSSVGRMLSGRKSTTSKNPNAPLTRIHREFCHSKLVPQVILHKASGSLRQLPLDHVMVDLSTVRCSATLAEYQSQILQVASEWGLELRQLSVSASCASAEGGSSPNEDVNQMEILVQGRGSFVWDESTLNRMSESQDSISKLPVLSLGVFEGERFQAKGMAKALAQQWAIPEEPPVLADTETGKAINMIRKKGHRSQRAPSKTRKGRRDENRRLRRQVKHDLSF